MDPKVENEEYGRSPLAEFAQVHSSRGDLTNTVRNRGFGVHSLSRDHDGEGDARTRVTNLAPRSRPDPASRNACVIPVCRAIVLGELGVLCGKQSPAGCTTRRLTRCRVGLEPGLSWSQVARRRRCHRFPAPAPNTRLTRRGLRPLATAGWVVGLRIEAVDSPSPP